MIKWGQLNLVKISLTYNSIKSNEPVSTNDLREKKMENLKSRIKDLAEKAKSKGEKKFCVAELHETNRHFFPLKPCLIIIGIILPLLLYAFSLSGTFWPKGLLASMGITIVLLFWIGFFYPITINSLKGTAKDVRNICKKMGLKPYVYIYGYDSGFCKMMVSFTEKKEFENIWNYKPGLDLQDYAV